VRKSLPIIIVLVIIAAVVGLVLANNNNNDTNTTPSPTPPPASSSNDNSSDSNNNNSSNNTTQPAATNKVTISNFSFSPSQITVKKGTTVTWTNSDNTPHTVTADSGTGPNSDTLQSGDTYSFKFDTVGSFSYHCSFHSYMHGTVVVTD